MWAGGGGGVGGRWWGGGVGWRWVEHSWASWGHVVVLVFFDSEKMFWIVSCLLEVSFFYLLKTFSVYIFLYWGGGGALLQNRALLWICHKTDPLDF